MTIVNAKERLSSTGRGQRHARAALIVALHGLALVLFFVSPLVGLASLGLVMVLIGAERKPMVLVAMTLGLLWINDIVADFYPYSRFTAWKDVVLLVLIFMWLLRSAVQRKPLLHRNEVTLTLAVFVAYYITMCVTSDSLTGAVLGLKAVIFYLMWFFLLPEIVKTREDVVALVTAIVVGTVCVSFYNFWRVQQPLGTFPPQRSGRIEPGVLQAHRAGSSLMLPYGILLLAALAPLAQGWRRLALWVCFAIVVAGLLVTALRSAWAGTVIGLLAIAFLGKRLPQMVGILVVVAVISGILQSSLQMQVSDRAISTFDSSDVSANARESETENLMIPFALTHPLGAGVGSMSSVSSSQVWGGSSLSFAVQGGTIHNNLLMLAIDSGWFGAALFAWLLFVAARTALRNFRDAYDPLVKALSLSLCGMIVYYIVLQFLVVTITTPTMSFMAFAVFSLLIILPRIDGPAEAVDRPTALAPAEI